MRALASLGEPDSYQINKNDILTAMKFDCHGNFLSVGDKGGRIIIFERIVNENNEDDFDYLMEFQSHEKEMDVLNSSDTSEAVTAIQWVNKYQNSNPKLLTSNAGCVKLWSLRQPKKKYLFASSVYKLKKGKGLTIPNRR